MNKRLRGLSLVATSAILFGLGSQAALADTVVVDGDVVTAITQQGEDMAFNNVVCNTSTSKNANAAVRHNGNGQVFEGGTANPVTISITGVTGAGLSATMGSTTTVALPDGWEDTANNTLSSTVSATVTLLSTTAGAGSGTVSFQASGREDGGTATIDRTGTLSVSWTTGSCAPTPTPTTTTITCPGAPYTYTGSAIKPCTASTKTSGGTEVATPTVTYGSNTNVGTATANASFAQGTIGGTTYAGSVAPQVTFGIGKATSTVTVTCPAGPYTYTGSALTPGCTATATGAGNLSVDVTDSIAFTDNTNPGDRHRQRQLRR